jgi:hypothetical protein
MIAAGSVVDAIRGRDRQAPLDDLERDPHAGRAAGLARERQRGMLDYSSEAAARTAALPTLKLYSETL